MPKLYKRKTNRPYVNAKAKKPAAEYAPNFMDKLDQRTELCRALRTRFDSLASDLGGHAKLSGIKSSLLERFLFLESTLAKIESDMATATDAKTCSALLGPWIQACNSLLGIARTLGIERQARNIDLKSYIADVTDTQKLPPRVVGTNGHDLEDK